MNRQPLVPITDRDVAAYRRDGFMSPPFEDLALAPGEVMDCETFPVVLPRS